MYLRTFFPVALFRQNTLWPVPLPAGLEAVEIAPGDTYVTPLAFASYPYSHSLLFGLLWAAAFGVAYGLAHGGRI
jgi:hypothetical protein